MNDSDAIDLLEDIVRTPSLSGDEGAAAAQLVRRMSRLGFEAQVDPAGNAIGTLGRKGPRVVLLGHIDTVSGDVPVRRANGRLYGRGAVDAKGPLVAFVAATARAAAAGTLACRVEIAGCVEEEHPSSKGARYRATFPAPDACIIGEPSGWEGVTLGYKGFLRARLTRRQSVGHTAAADPGAAATTCRLFAHLEQEAAAFGAGRTALFDQLLLHLKSIHVDGDGLHDHAELDLRLRLPPDLSPEQAAAWLAARAPDWRVDTEGGLPAWSGPRTSPLARLLGRSIARAGGRARYQRKTGTADLNVVAPAWGCPALAYGPGDSALDHTPDEHIELDEFVRGIHVLEGLLSDAAGLDQLADQVLPSRHDADLAPTRSPERAPPPDHDAAAG